MVWVSFYVSREKVNFSTKVSVDEKNWNDKKKSVGIGDKLSSDKNLIIENILSRINNVLVKYRLRDKKINRNLFLKEYHRPSDYDTFYDFVADYQKKIASRMEVSTLITHTSVINKLKEFNRNLIFDEITKEWLDTYFLYLKKEMGNNSNTAYKNMTTLKKYVRAAFQAGYIDENPFENWKIKRTTSNCTYLNEDELKTLVTLYKSGELDHKLHKSLEFFLFLCFSSLHVGDAKKLKLEQFTETSFVYFRIKLKNSKPEPIQVPISEPLRQLMKNIVGTRKKGYIFESIASDQAMNKFLKSVASTAEIDKVITHKVGRHTFATYYLKETKDLASLKEIMGHSDLKETLIYAHVLDESKQEGMRCFNSFEF